MKYLILILILILFSCKPSNDCDSTAEDFKIDECILVVQKTPGIRDNIFDYEGINPITKKKCDCNSLISDRWWSHYKNYIAIGDTIIKRKGELTFHIHKKDTILSFNFECDGKVYN